MAAKIRKVTFVAKSETEVDGVLLPPGKYQGIERHILDDDEALPAPKYQMNLTEEDLKGVRGLEDFRGAIIDATSSVEDGSLRVSPAAIRAWLATTIFGQLRLGSGPRT